mgnify:CR=1 FL=1
MIEEYLNVWRSSLKIEESLSRKSFWMFFGINYVGFGVLAFIFESSENELFLGLFQLIYFGYLLALLSAGMRRMNDIKKPIGYVFVPLYNFYLCLLPSFNEDKVASPNHSLRLIMFLKIVMLSFLIGVISFISIAHLDFGGGYGALFVYAIVIGICVIVNPIIITSCLLLLYAFKKGTIDAKFLSFYFLIIGILVVIITNRLAYLAISL